MFAKSICAVVGFGLASLIAQPSFANVTTFDFTSGDYAAADGQGSFYNAADGVTLLAAPDGSLLETSEASGLPGYSKFIGAAPLELGQDGIGVSSDEIDGNQSILVTFDEALLVTSFAVLDLFKHDSDDSSNAEQVTATFTFENIALNPVVMTFNATMKAFDNVGGYNVFDVDLAGEVSSIKFTAAVDPSLNDDYNNDFAIAAIQSAVPEPATWLMMLAGFAMTGFALKRRKGVAAAA